MSESGTSKEGRKVYAMKPSQIVFDVTESPDGSFEAKAIGYSIFTLGDSWDDLKFMVKDAVLCHFDADEMPSEIRLHLVKQEVIAV